MPAKTPERASAAGSYAQHYRHHGPDDPRTLDAARDLRAAALAENITEAIDAAPPLTDAQRARLTRLLWQQGQR